MLQLLLQLLQLLGGFLDLRKMQCWHMTLLVSTIMQNVLHIVTWVELQTSAYALCDKTRKACYPSL